MIDVVTVGAGGGSIAWLSPEGTLKVGPRSAGADPGPLCYAKGGTEPTVTDAHARARPDPAAPARRRDPARRRAPPATASSGLADQLGLTLERCATGILEISAWNQANALRQITVKRGLDVRDFTLTTFGGSGLAAACRLSTSSASPACWCRPTRATSRRSGCSPSTSRTTTCRPRRPARPARPRPRRRRSTTTLDRPGRTRAGRGGLRRASSSASCAPPTCATSARPSRCGCRARRRRSTPACADGVAAFHAAAPSSSTATTSRDDPRQQVEWVNLRVTGIGPITRPELRELAAGVDGDALDRARQARARSASTPSGLRRHRATGGPTSRRRRRRRARRSSRSSARRAGAPGLRGASTPSATLITEERA